ncbi:MAG: hypothetical protein HQK66_13000, partial [Desulfamplus sp.]|nr:hypothetical protein [Desulfamplus sp.]
RKITTPYTCNEYREEMILAGLRKRLARPDISPSEQRELLREVEKLEQQMGF